MTIQMTKEQAARILDPDTSGAEVKYLEIKYGWNEARFYVDKATKMGANALRKLAQMEDDRK